MRTRRSVSICVAVATVAIVTLAGCSTSASPSKGNTSDNGTTLTMWTRALPGTPVQKLVDLYNSTHKNQVKLTTLPGDSYQQKIGAAAGSNSLPDILSADVVYSPNYVSQGVFQDISSTLKKEPYYKDLSKAHINAASLNGKQYGVPLDIDSSLMIYNKTLFKKAGLDPNTPPVGFDNIYNDAKAIRALGGDTYGFYFGGNCAGCTAYTAMPSAVAAGFPTVADQGKKVSIDNSAMTAEFALYKKMYDEGIVPSSAKTEDGTTWATAFTAGQIGMEPLGSGFFSSLKDVKFDWGVAPLASPDGKHISTFVGGDIAGITKNSKHYKQALNFLMWSLTDAPQIDVWAKNGFLTPRTDLADNKYSAKDPRLVQTIKNLKYGYTPSSLPYGDIFNNANGSWNEAYRNFIFNDDANALKAGQKTSQAEVDAAYK